MKRFFLACLIGGSASVRAVSFFDICATYLGGGPKKLEIVEESFSPSKEDSEGSPPAAHLLLEMKGEREERSARRFDYSQATRVEVEAYGARVGVSYKAGDDVEELVRLARKRRPIPQAFVPSSLRAGGDSYNVFAPGALTHKNVDERAVEHMFFRGSQVEDQRLRSAFSKVVTFGHGGTGVLISNTGLILTAKHVVNSLESRHVRHQARLRGLSQNSIYLQDNVFGKHQWKRIDLGPEFEKFDVAVIHIPQLAGVTPVPMAQNLPNTAETVFAIGYPEIEDYETKLRPLLSVGRVFAPQSVQNVRLESNVEVRPGSSGGPVLNENGEIVGIIVSGGRMLFTTNATAEPLPVLRQLLDSLRDRKLSSSR